MGSELYAYFDVQAGECSPPSSQELAADAGSRTCRATARDEPQVVARLDAASGARPGKQIELVLDTSHIQLFDPAGGTSLTAESEAAAPA